MARYIYLNKKNLGNAISDIEFWRQYSGLVDGRVVAVSTVPTAGGTGYTADDTLTITTGDGNAQVTVATVHGVTGAVLTLKPEIVAAGAGYTTSVGNPVTGGTGNNDCTVAIEAQKGYSCDEHAIATLRGEGYTGTLLGMISTWIKSDVQLT
jgi:hypothetical protein